MSRWLLFALRLLIRDWRAGELRVLLAAVLVAVASLATVSLFTDRMRSALNLQANEMLGADVIVAGDRPLPETFSGRAQQQGLQISRTASFPSMVTSRNQSVLAAVKAVGPGYPLRGALDIQADRNPPVPAQGIPAAGTVWIDERLANRLGAQVGDQIDLGQRTFRLAALITRQPDSALDVFNVAPRLLLNDADLPGTGLIGVGSRVQYRLLLAGPAEQIERYRKWAESSLGRGQRVEGIRDARAEVRSALERAEQFLDIAALTAAILAAVAIAQAAQRYGTRHLDHCALLRAMGATQGRIVLLFTSQLVMLGLLSGLLGAALGYVGQAALAHWLTGLVASELPAPSLWPLLQAAGLAFVLLVGFALPPLLRLRKTPPLRVLRRDLEVADPPAILTYGLGFALLAAVLLARVADPKLAGAVIGGFAGALLLAAGVAWLAVLATSLLRGRAGLSWRSGIANLRRRTRASVLQIVALSIGMMALLFLTVIRGDLLAAWERSIPADAPNRFVINVQPEQVAPVQQLLQSHGIQQAELYPMIRGRLTHIADRPVAGRQYSEDRARRLAEREFNLSWTAQQTADNQLIRGRYWTTGSRGEWSVEEGLAKTLGIQLGDTLTFEVSGKPVSGKVTSLRKVHWDSFRVNFFVVSTPDLLQAETASHISSFHLPASDTTLTNELVRQFPNVTVIDIGMILGEVRLIMNRVASAVQFVFLFTLAAGILVLFAALGASHDERRREAAILRALGATRRQVLVVQSAEFVLIGAIAGLVASSAGAVLGYLIGSRFLNLPLTISPELWLYGIGGAVFCTLSVGLAAALRTLATPPLATLRAEG